MDKRRTTPGEGEIATALLRMLKVGYKPAKLARQEALGPLFRLHCVGGPHLPEGWRDARQRVETVRALLRDLVPRFEGMGDQELEGLKSRQPIEPLCAAVELIFQLSQKKPSAPESEPSLPELYAKVGRLWNRGDRWFERNRRSFVLKWLSVWILEAEQSYRAAQPGSQNLPTKLTTPTPKASGGVEARQELLRKARWSLSVFSAYEAARFQLFEVRMGRLTYGDVLDGFGFVPLQILFDYRHRALYKRDAGALVTLLAFSEVEYDEPHVSLAWAVEDFENALPAFTRREQEMLWLASEEARGNLHAFMSRLEAIKRGNHALDKWIRWLGQKRQEDWRVRGTIAEAGYRIKKDLQRIKPID